MGLPHSQVVRVTCHSVSRTVKIPLFEPVREEKQQPKKLANDSRVPAEIRPVATVITSEEIHQLSNGAMNDARLFIESVEPRTVEVQQQPSRTVVVLPK